MRASKTSALILLAAAFVAGCSFLDFFGYEDNAPLHVVSRPEGYPSARFGAEIAPTTYIQGDQEMDLVGVSGGMKTPTLIYGLSKNGDLLDVEDPYDEYLSDKITQADDEGSGASLVGLPTWKNGDMYTGCMAIGEPSINRVTVFCEQDKEYFHIDASATGEGGAENFGLHMATVRPYKGDNWLLAVASKTAVTIFSSSASSANNRSEPVNPTYQDAQVPTPINELAAGRLGDGRIYVAAATGDSTNNVPARVHLFVQQDSTSKIMVQRGCMNLSGEPGFGGTMTTGDLDADGEDELIVGFASGDQRRNEVAVWRVPDIVDAAPGCNSEEVPRAATVVPDLTDSDVECDTLDCDFGTTLTVGDISTDDDTPELIVGAPGATVDGSDDAGAVFVFRGDAVMNEGEPEAAGIVRDSTAHGGNRFGGGLAVGSMAGRNELMVGAPGKGKFFIAYCTGVGEDINEGADTTSSAGGSVVSTRCRAD